MNMHTDVDKKKIAAKIAALRNKTVENGASEAEAIAAAEKMHELLFKYQIEMGDFEIRSQGVIQARTPHYKTEDGVKLSYKMLKVKWYLAGAVADYCDCKAWGSGDDIVVMGLPSDVDFYIWLIDSLGVFTIRQMNNYMRTEAPPYDGRPNGRQWQAQKAFVYGCLARISQRLRRAKSDAEPEQQKTSGGRELIVLKNQLVTEEFAKLALKLKSGRGVQLKSRSGYQAGMAAGEGASFGRPVNGNGHMARLK